jgi:hypothetical protein
MNLSEQYCHWVSSHGIAKSCDYYIRTVEDFENFFYRNRNYDNGVIIYLHIDRVPLLIKYIDNITFSFILVSGCGDTIIPIELFTCSDDFLKFIHNNKIIAWYSQNCIVEHPKIFKIPIGLDYHSLTNGGPNHPWGESCTPIEQESLLNDIREVSLPFWERIVMCYSNFHLNIRNGMRIGCSRQHIIDTVSKDLIFYEPQFVSREESWLQQSKYAFVISPHGNGLDCHRTWEALILGCIPIVKKSPIDSLYENLPVLIVDDWQDINMDLLNKTIEDYKSRTFLFDKLTLSYYINKIRNT